MSAKTNTQAEAVLNTIRGTTLTAYTPYVGLISSGTTELASSGSYARVSATFGAPSGTPRAISNSGAVTFPTATAGWVEATRFGIYDAASAGNLRYVADLTTPRTVGDGDTAEFAIGALVITEA